MCAVSVYKSCLGFGVAAQSLLHGDQFLGGRRVHCDGVTAGKAGEVRQSRNLR